MTTATTTATTYSVRLSRRVRGVILTVTDIRFLDERTIAATEIDGTEWEIKNSDIVIIKRGL